MPQHLVLRDDTGSIVGCCPLYLKGHSYGEYVFDQSWASFASRVGISYYPKLQCCVPFTPVTGARLLARPDAGVPVEAIETALARGVKSVADAYDLSSAHVTFSTRQEWSSLAQEGFLKRVGLQYHWYNEGYATFDEFLMDLRQSKRKSIRQERNKVARAGYRRV